MFSVTHITGLQSGYSLDHAGAISLDNVVTIPAALLGRPIGQLSEAQERRLATAIVLAYDLDIPLCGD